MKIIKRLLYLILIVLWLFIFWALFQALLLLLSPIIWILTWKNIGEISDFVDNTNHWFYDLLDDKLLE